MIKKKSEKIIEAYVISDVGKARLSNQDNYLLQDKRSNLNTMHSEERIELVLKKPSIFVAGIFDGMGGESYGEVASSLAAQSFHLINQINIKHIKSDHDIKDAIVSTYHKSNHIICQECKLRKTRLGTTATLMIIKDDQVILSNIGDSRIYRYRDHVLEQQSIDHTEAMTLKMNNIPIKSKKGRLTQYLGVFEDEYIIEPYIKIDTIMKNDLYILCSDGITDMLTDNDIARILDKYDLPKDATSELIKEALAKGGNDNCTVMICKIRDNQTRKSIKWGKS